MGKEAVNIEGEWMSRDGGMIVKEGSDTGIFAEVGGTLGEDWKKLSGEEQGRIADALEEFGEGPGIVEFIQADDIESFASSLGTYIETPKNDTTGVKAEARRTLQAILQRAQ